MGFDSSILERKWQRPLEPIEYREDLPKIIELEEWNRAIVFGTPSPSIVDRRWALVKHSDWRYEREWRFVLAADSHGPQTHEDIPFPAGALVSVVSGCRADVDLASKVLLGAQSVNPEVAYARVTLPPDRLSLTSVDA
ncbi:MAG: DUF2971 domain-containing protein [Phycisphaeraceae bacterium]|nr:DUF2971 domain-containing protein [Phycisphaeraceae bacterium]